MNHDSVATQHIAKRGVNMDTKRENDIKSWIEESLEDQDISEHKIGLVGTTEKTEGYLADIIYAKVIGKDAISKQQKEINLFVKLGKKNEELRRNMTVMKKINEREICFYDKVLPTFKKFLETKDISAAFDIFPKCYKTIISDEMEVLILEDLRKIGYKLLDNRESMNLQHTYLVLRTYAKIHALSFALRHQNRNEFDKVIADYYPINREFILKMRTFRNSDTRCKKTLIDAGRMDLCDKYDQLVNYDVEKVIEDILDDVPEESVIIHCDCHHNNILFKYEDEDGENPTNVAVIDWQLSEVHSPVLDVAFFLFGGAPLGNLPHLDTLLIYYHTQLSNFLSDLGSDVDEIFPFSKLLEHWTRYSNYGFLWAMTFLKFAFCDPEDAPSFDTITESYDLSDLIGDMRVNDAELYGKRIAEIVDLHWEFHQLISQKRSLLTLY